MTSRTRPIEDVAIEFGDLTIDVAAYQVLAAGRLIDMAPRQIDLLAELARHGGAIVPFAALSTTLWGVESGHMLPLRTAISKLRKALGEGPRRPAIVTEPHVGYRLVVPTDL